MAMAASMSLATVNLLQSRQQLAVKLPRRTRQQCVSLRARSTSICATAVEAAPALGPAITLSDTALEHLKKMRATQEKNMLLRIGVRQGGCSGFSYVMDFEERANIQEGDSIVEYEGFSMVCDPKSLLFLYGMRLDYSDALIGGGFAFSNPNASATCGCGKSFAA